MKEFNIVNISIYEDTILDFSAQHCEKIYKNILLGIEKNFKNDYEDVPFAMSDDLKFLFDKIKISVEETYSDREVQRIEYWGHLHEKNMSTQDHAHFDSEAFDRGENWLSGVFYLKVPEGSGKIVFLFSKNPHSREMFDVLCEYSPKNNIVLIFPTWLIHRVTRNKSEDHRVSIGFNILLREKQGIKYPPKYTTIQQPARHSLQGPLKKR